VNFRLLLLGALAVLTTSVGAATFHFETDHPDGKMAMGTFPPNFSFSENEVADDFILDATTRVDHATFTGLFVGGGSADTIGEVVVEIYRVFPLDSASPAVGRINSPSDYAYATRDSLVGELTFTATVDSAPADPFCGVQAGTCAAINSVLTGVQQNTGSTPAGDGPVSGKKVTFDVTLNKPLLLPAGHYFFVPQVALEAGAFYWLSSPKPTTGPGTAIAPDLQAWMRNDIISPAWLRVGTDIVGGPTPPTFNAAFSLDGETDSTVHVQTSTADGRMAMEARPIGTRAEVEAADDFVVASASQITHATFTGLIGLPAVPSDINDVTVKIYRIFPDDSEITRAPGVPTRSNSPSDNEFSHRDSQFGGASYTVLPASRDAAFCDTQVGTCTVTQSVTEAGIFASPNQTTGGEAAVTGVPVVVDVTFEPPFSLPAGHYFIVPQVGLTNGTFYWLSSQAPSQPDLQTWIRDLRIAPDWLRVGTDIVGGAAAPKFNGTFSLDGDANFIFTDGFEIDNVLRRLKAATDH